MRKKVGQKSPTFNKSQPYKSVEDQDPLKTTPRRSLQSILELLFSKQDNSQSFFVPQILFALLLLVRRISSQHFFDGFPG